MIGPRMRLSMAALVLAPLVMQAQQGPGGGGSPSVRPDRAERATRADEIRGRLDDVRDRRAGGDDARAAGRGPDGQGGIGQGGAQRGARLDPRQRQVVEQRLRERFAGVVRQQLGLDDRQFRQLRETNRQFEGQRRDLVQRERQARLSVRDELQRGDGADNARVGEQMQEMLKIQREKLQLVETEDKALAEFLTPAQRAKYFGMQEQLRRRVEEIRRRALLGDLPSTGTTPP